MSVVALQKQTIGAGIYMVSDISNILGFSKAKVRRYLNEYWDERLGKKLFNDTYSWSVGNNIKAVNFYTLIELFTCFRLQELGVSPKQVLKSRESIAKDLKMPFPFASANLLTDGKKIWYEFKDAIINADGSQQMNFVELIKNFAVKIDFNSKNFADRFWPEGKNNSIVVDPHHQFGQPIINGTNIITETIFSMYKSGEPLDSLSILYDLSEKQLNDAIQFSKRFAA